MIDTSRTLRGVHHIHTADYITSGRALCGRVLSASAQAYSIRAADLDELRMRAGQTPTGLCARCESASERGQR